MTPLELTDYDRQFYAERIHDFLPERIVDCHTHIWTTDHLLPPDAAPRVDPRPGRHRWPWSIRWNSS